MNKLYSEVEVQVCDVTGKLVASKTEINKNKIALTINGEAGIYFLAIKTNEGTLVKKVAKE